MSSLFTNFIIFISIAYFFLLFYIAYLGDKQSIKNKASGVSSQPKNYIYSLSIAVYCSSWTFFGAVGSAAHNGWDFFAIYLGPILVFVFAYKLIQRIIQISKQYSITSISDFLSARFGKSRPIAILVTCVCMLGSLPYISLQLQAISMSFLTLTSSAKDIELGVISGSSFLSDTAFYSAIVLSLFSIIFGTRNLGANEHNRGMMKAIAFESMAKFFALMLISIYASYLLFSQFDWPQIAQQPLELLNIGSDESRFSIIDFIIKLVLSMGVILLLPRQFLVTIVEADNKEQVNAARWQFPLYLLLISLFIVPIAISGMMLLPDVKNADLYVLLIPQRHDQNVLSVIAFLGGISAAASMVIVATIGLSTMICNDLILPLFLKGGYINLSNNSNITLLTQRIRRISIALMMLLSYLYFKISSGNQLLADTGLLSFSALVQLAPALLASLYWQKANQRGVIIGLCIGFSLWAYCLLLPTLMSQEILDLKFNVLTWLHPQHLFNITALSPLSHGVLISLFFNVLGLIFGSFSYKENYIDRLQAIIFYHVDIQNPRPSLKNSLIKKATIKNAETLCLNIIGPEKTKQLFSALNEGHDSSSFQFDFSNPTSEMLNSSMIAKIEQAITSVVGVSSAQQIIASQLLSNQNSSEDLFVMLGETTKAIQFNQNILLTSFENIDQGISIIDKNLNLIAWNNRYKTLFDLPEKLLRIGTPIESLIRFNAKRGECGPGELNKLVKKRLNHLLKGTAYTFDRYRPNGSFLRIHGNPVPNGGFVTSYTDVTEQKKIELAVRNSERQIQLYTDNLPLMLCFTGLDEKIHFSNKAYNQFVGKTREEMKGISIHDLLDRYLIKKRQKYIERAFNGETVKFECEHFLSLDNKSTPVYYQISFITNILANGATDGFFSIYQDISKAVESAALLKKSNEALEERVSQRTQELEILNKALNTKHQNTLALTEKLKNATISKTKFLAAASHDLLQPINAARLFTHSLVNHSEPNTSPKNRVLQKIDSSLDSADKLLRTLLNISKLDTGVVTATIKNFNINALFQELGTEFSPIALKKGVSLHFVFSSVMISSDRTLLRSIIQNLISNAIRYTETGSILIGCRRHSVGKVEKIKIQVFDTGTGLKKENLSLIFDEFYRIPNPAYQEKRGIGLGLSIAKRLADMLQHELSVRSVLTSGSCFTIDVPRYRGAPITTKPTNTWQPKNEIAGTTILYLENSIESLEAMELLLSSWGCKVIPCQTYKNAISTIQQSGLEIDIILADYQLDDQETGLDFITSPLVKNTKIACVLVTAEQDISIKKNTLNAGHFFLSKPLEPATLRSILASVAQKHSNEK